MRHVDLDLGNAIEVIVGRVCAFAHQNHTHVRGAWRPDRSRAVGDNQNIQPKARREPLRRISSGTKPASFRSEATAEEPMVCGLSAGGNRIRTLGPWWKRTVRLPLDLGALGCCRSITSACARSIRRHSRLQVYAGGGTKPPVSAESSRANSIVVVSSPSGPIICSPTGNPSPVKPIGAAVAGRYDRLASPAKNSCST